MNDNAVPGRGTGAAERLEALRRQAESIANDQDLIESWTVFN